MYKRIPKEIIAFHFRKVTKFLSTNHVLKGLNVFAGEH